MANGISTKIVCDTVQFYIHRQGDERLYFNRIVKLDYENEVITFNNNIVYKFVAADLVLPVAADFDALITFIVGSACYVA